MNLLPTAYTLKKKKVRIKHVNRLLERGGHTVQWVKAEMTESDLL